MNRDDLSMTGPRKTLGRAMSAALVPLFVLAACNCGPAVSPAATNPARPASGEQAADPTPTGEPTEPTTDAEPQRIRISVPAAEGTREYTADLAAPALLLCQHAADGTCAPLDGRDANMFRPDWQATVARLARASRGAQCEPATGPTVTIDIDGARQDIVLPPYPAGRDYRPPSADELRECAPRELARTVMIYLSWE